MTQLLTNSNIQQLTERISDWHSEDVKVDQKNRLVRNVALAGKDSKNGYRYNDQALKNAATLYNSKPVFLDHASNLARPYQRSTRDLVGSVVRPRFEHGRIRGDIQTLDTEAGRTFIALAETCSPAVGMSHVVLAERSTDRSVVEKIHEVVSIDAVVFPATTSTFSESINGQPALIPGSYESALAEIDLRLQGHLHRLTGDSALQGSRTGLFAEHLIISIKPDQYASEKEHNELQYYAIRWMIQDGEIVLGDELEEVSLDQLQDAKWSVSREKDTHHSNLASSEQLQQKLNQAVDDRNDLLKQVEKLVNQRNELRSRQEVEQLLSESRLPSSSIDDSFRKQLISLPDKQSRLKLINERQQFIRQLTTSLPNSLERNERLTTKYSDELIVQQLRGTTISPVRK